MKQIVLFCVVIFTVGLSCGEQLNESSVPVAVKNEFIKKYPNARDIEWSKENETEFEAEFKNGSLEQAANFDTTGNWVVTETKVKKSDLPALVTAAIETDFAGYKIEAIERVEKPNNEDFFEVTVEKDKKKYHVQVSPQGKILKKEEDKEEKGEKEKD